MNLNELSREQLLLLNTDFGSELEKQAEALVDSEVEKIAELQEQASELYNYGAQLAMQKIAEMEENYKHEEDESKDKEEGEEEEKKEEEEKTAAGTGSYILTGFWDTLMEKGAEYYGDQNIYLEELVKQTGFDKIAANVKNVLKGVAKKTTKKAPKREAPGFIDRKVCITLEKVISMPLVKKAKKKLKTVLSAMRKKLDQAWQQELLLQVA
jgi:hypothetical protein